jgi:hypothetical protein
MFDKIRAKKFAEADLERIKEIAQGGQEEALSFLRELGFKDSSEIRSMQFVHQCREFVEVHSEPWWIYSRRFHFVTLDERGPAVEVLA